MSKYLKAADEELRKLEQHHLDLLRRLAPVTRRQAEDFMAEQADLLGCRHRARDYASLSHRELIEEGKFLARALFDQSDGACVHAPDLTTWAACTNEQITEILRVLWIPRLIQ